MLVSSSSGLCAPGGRASSRQSFSSGQASDESVESVESVKVEEYDGFVESVGGGGGVVGDSGGVLLDEDGGRLKDMVSRRLRLSRPHIAPTRRRRVH